MRRRSGSPDEEKEAVRVCCLGNSSRDENNSQRLTEAPFLLSYFSPGDKIENCSAQFLAVRWIVHVEFKVHRLRDGFSVSNPLLLGQSHPAFIGHDLDKIGEGTFSKDAICSSLFRCSSRTVRLSFPARLILRIAGPEGAKNPSGKSPPPDSDPF